jgi:hypothetical protein
MKSRITWMAAAAVAGAALFGAPAAGAAQQADGWWEWALRDMVEARSGGNAVIPLPRGDRDRGQARGARGARGAQAGPPFCANGQGHPVHGPQWCREKGFGSGAGVIFDRRGWDDVVLRAPRGTDRRGGMLDQGGLIDVLGDVVFGRVTAEGQRLGATGPMTGRWLTPDGAARVLQIRAGGIPVAELTDLNGNGRIDAVLTPR